MNFEQDLLNDFLLFSKFRSPTVPALPSRSLLTVSPLHLFSLEEEENRIYNAFWDAVKQGREDSVERFLRTGLIADIDRLHSFGQSNALLDACFGGYLNIARKLLERGANANIVIRNRTPLMVAAQRGNLPLTQLLIQSGADVSPRITRKRTTSQSGLQGETPLHVAIRYGHHPVVSLLLESGANFLEPNRSGDTAYSLVLRFE